MGAHGWQPVRVRGGVEGGHGGKIVRIEGDPAPPVGRGRLCPAATADVPAGAARTVRPSGGDTAS